ncbi:hypothetical protein [Campylobacter fetus]|uniref:hypothetical protein n=1 Tax=Campylobacter fetus TaxID=196 RepID=UPI00122EAC3B|nr:hypothetical protein [Campylobacter fetus]KAA3684593.1 hypothetical protein E3U42_09800 [Campylobacter fetus subsp. fetus]
MDKDIYWILTVIIGWIYTGFRIYDDYSGSEKSIFTKIFIFITIVGLIYLASYFKGKYVGYR